MSPFQRLMRAVEAYDKLVESPYVAALVERALVEVLNAARALVDVNLTYPALVLQEKAKPAHRSTEDKTIYSAKLDVPSGGFDLCEVLGVGWTHLSGLYVVRDVDGSDMAGVQFSRPATPEEITAARRAQEEAAKSETARKRALYEQLKAEFEGK